jgi:C_GCAxxG_C_C family probable redox protein
MGRSADDAENTFHLGYNCAQAVLTSFSQRFSLDREIALRLSAAFGGGIARRGQVCGAVSGGLMALGLARARTDLEGKEENYSLAQEFMLRFEEAHGSLLCRDLIKVDLSTPEGRQQAHDNGITRTLCPALVRSAAEILESLLLSPSE